MTKRPMVWAAAFCAAAVAVLTALPQLNIVLAGLCLAAAALALVRPVPPAVRSGALLLSFALALALGAVWVEAARAEPLLALDGTTAPVRMTVLEESEGTGYSRLSLYGLVETGEGWKTAAVMAYDRETIGWQPGDRVEGVLRFSVPAEAGRARYLRSRGQFAYANVESLIPLETEETLPGGLRVWGAKVNYALSQGLLSALPNENGGFLQSVLLGRREALAEGVDKDMRRSGVAHIMVVSGLHLSLLCAAAGALLRRCGAGPVVRAAGGCVVCLGVMAITGFTPSVVRGGVVLVLSQLAELVGRRSDGLSALGTAVLLMLVVNPYVLYSWSFQLSVCSVLSILVFAPVLRRGLLGWRRQRLPVSGWLDGPLGALAVSLGAAVYTYPLLSVMFGGLAVYGPLGNLLITPLVGAMLVLSVVAAVLGALGLGAAASVVALPAGLLARFCRWAAGLVANLPGSWLPIDRLWQVAWLVGAAVVLSLLVAFGPKTKKHLPALALGLCLPLLVGMALGSLSARNTVELRTFEGSGALVVVQQGRAVVVDADRAALEEVETLGAEAVLCTFAEGSPAAVRLLQQQPGVAAAFPAGAAGQLVPYLSAETRLLALEEPITLRQGFGLEGKTGYTILTIDGLRVLKLRRGYVIIEESDLPPADVVVDGQGNICAAGQTTRTLRFRTK